jgi:ParB family chromosome partitioning protein
MVLKLPVDFAKKIGEVLVLQMQGVDQLFTVEEDRAGYFVAKLKHGQFLDRDKFRTMCALARDLGGEGYVEGAKAWKVPGPFAKKSPEMSSGQAVDHPATYKAPGSALPAAPSIPVPVQKEYTFLPLTALLSMQFQSRTVQEGPEFDELVESVKALGVLQPILVRPKGGLFEIVYGERRTAAAKQAGLHEIPARIKDLSDQEAYEIQLIENIQRKDLSDMEKARILGMMIKQFGYTQEALAQKLGKSQPWVSQHLAMLQIPEIASKRGEIITRVIKSPQIGEITEHQAREILAAPEEKHEEIVEKINETGKVPSVREIHEIAHPGEKPRTVSCARCGDATSVPVNLSGKFYCAECAEQVVEESKSGHGPSIEPGTGEEVEKVEVEEGEEREKVAEKTSKAEQLKAIGIGEFECTECHQHFLVEHMPNGKHKLKAIHQEET